MIRSARLSIVALVGLAASAGSAQDAYSLHVAPPIWPGSTSESTFYDVNDAGVVLGVTTFRDQLPNGNFSITNVAFRWTAQDGWLTDGERGLDAINNVGDAATGGPTGTVFFADGSSGQISPFGGDVSVAVNAMNDSGMVVGHSRRQGSISQGVLREALIWSPDEGAMSFRDVVPDAGAARDVNDAGEVVGIAGNGLFENNQAFYYDSVARVGVDLHALLVPVGNVGVRSEANGINEAGQVVGWRDTGFGGDRRAFLWSADDGVTLLPSALTDARAINNDGVVVGRNYLYTADDGLVDLNTLADVGDFQIVMAQAISDTGIIVGWGLQPGSPRTAAFALVPASGCNAADLSTPLGFLDLSDVDAFINAFIVADPAADLVSPFGFVDLSDVDAFIAAFLAGCP